MPVGRLRGHPLLELTPVQFDPDKVVSWEVFAAEHSTVAGWLQSLDAKDPAQSAIRIASKIVFKLPDPGLDLD